MSSVIYNGIVQLQGACRSLANGLSTLDTSHRDHALRIVSLSSRIDSLENQIANLVRLVGENTASATPAASMEEIQAIKDAAKEAIAHAKISQQAAANAADSALMASVCAKNAASVASVIPSASPALPSSPDIINDFTFSAPEEPQNVAIPDSPDKIDQCLSEVVKEGAEAPKPRKRPSAASRKTKA